MHLFSDKLTIEEKAALLEGYKTWSTNPVPRLGIRSIFITDGPHGLRKVRNAGGAFAVSDNEHSTSFPTASALASSWDPNAAYEMGRAIAKECILAGVDVVLAPGVNIKRSPLCGRNFEYYSEDPLVSGIFGESFVNGVQSMGVGCSVKHFAANSSEDYRFTGNSIVDERALIEIYLTAFERVVKKANPYTVMCSYNEINGVIASENEWLLTEILRDKWGFDGLVMTDWGATRNRIEGIRAGCDLDMPGSVLYNRKSIIDAAKSGELLEADINRSVEKVLNLIDRCSDKEQAKDFDIKENEKLSCELAKKSAVLLKNDGVLPLNGTEKLLVIGEMFEKLRFQGAGSSLINPSSVISAKDAFDNRGIEYTYKKGYRSYYKKDNPALMNEVVKAADNADIILFFGGLTDFEESEGFDRKHMSLDDRQIRLLERLTATGKKVVFVMHTGAPVTVPCLDKLSGVLNMYLAGMNGGEATAALLLGEAVPSGKLAESWPIAAIDTSCYDDYDNDAQASYYESIYVGYRFYDKAKTKLQFPFGFGLSYTKFEYTNISAVQNDGDLIVTADITNTGTFDGEETVQLYVKNNESKVFKAEKELRAFTKVFLYKGETKKVILSFKKKNLSYWDVKLHCWVLENGAYEIYLAASSSDIRLTAPLVISDGTESASPYSENIDSAYFKPPVKLPKSFIELCGNSALKEDVSRNKKPGIEASLSEVKKTFFGRLIYWGIMAMMKNRYAKAKRMPDSLERDAEIKNSYFLVRLMPTNSLRSMCMSSSGQLSYHAAEGIAQIADGHLIKGLRSIFKREQALPLPVEKQGDSK